jgi:hypothetical protein
MYISVVDGIMSSKDIQVVIFGTYEDPLLFIKDGGRGQEPRNVGGL